MCGRSSFAVLLGGDCILIGTGGVEPPLRLYQSRVLAVIRRAVIIGDAGFEPA